jgi:hypothetical protein
MANPMDYINKNDQNLKRKKKKKYVPLKFIFFSNIYNRCPRPYIIITILTTIMLSITIIVLLTVILTKSKTSTSNSHILSILFISSSYLREQKDHE